MHKVYSHENLAIASSAKSLLELHGIDCFLKNEFHASGGHVGFEAVPIELWVYDSSRAQEAVSLLEQELNPSTDEPDWQCRHCGEDNDASFETCWKCQHPASES